MYKKVVYKTKEEAAIALQKMVQRKREWFFPEQTSMTNTKGHKL